MREVNMKLRKAFIRLLKDKGLKMKFISEKLNLDYTTMSKWKNGHFDYCEDTLKSIAYFLEKL